VERTSLAPALSPRRGRIIRRVFENSCGGVCRMVTSKSEDVQRRLLLLGEKAGLRASVKPKMSCEGSETGKGF
jgi:hypothetical protein